MTIKNIYVSFFRYLRKPVVPGKFMTTGKFKFFIALFVLSFLADLSLDQISTSHWLLRSLGIVNINSPEDEIYKLGFFFALIVVSIFIPLIEESLQRSYLTSFYWNNYLISVNTGIICVLLFHIRGNTIFVLFGFVLFGFVLIISYMVSVLLQKNAKTRFAVLRLYSKNYGFYFYLSAISFGIAHVGNYEIQNFIPVLPVLLVLPQIFAGVALGYIRNSMGLKYSMLFHWLHNLIFILVLFIMHKEA